MDKLDQFLAYLLLASVFAILAHHQLFTTISAVTLRRRGEPYRAAQAAADVASGFGGMLIGVLAFRYPEFFGNLLVAIVTGSIGTWVMGLTEKFGSLYR